MENIYNTTFVTCCFDCNKNNFFIKTYLKRSLRTLLIDVPLIIYCEQEYAHIFIGIRKLFNLEHITKVITTKLEDLFFYKYKSNLLRGEDLNTNYNKNAHIVMVNKFKFLLDTIEENPFNTSHFGWIDINLLEKTFNDSVNYLDKNIYDKISNICKNPRDKFTIELLNQWTPDMYQDLNIFYSKYQWIVAGCFFTMDAANGKFILQKLMDKAIEITLKGYGSGEESFFSFVIDENTDKFNLYVGDYQDTIHNYFKIEKNQNYVNMVINKWYNSGRTEIFNNIISTINKYN